MPPNKKPSKEMLALEVENARKCMEDCPNGKLMRERIAENSNKLLVLLLERSVSSPEDISYIRGALAQLEDVLAIPKELTIMLELLEKKKIDEEKTMHEQKEKKKELTL
jgi:hypothetical protein